MNTQPVTGPYAAITEGRVFKCVIVAADGEPVAEVYGNGEQEKATARLLAAAPDLYSACLSAAAYLTDPASKFPENRRAAAELIKDALACVEGK